MAASPASSPSARAIGTVPPLRPRAARSTSENSTHGTASSFMCSPRRLVHRRDGRRQGTVAAPLIDKMQEVPQRQRHQQSDDLPCFPLPIRHIPASAFMVYPHFTRTRRILYRQAVLSEAEALHHLGRQADVVSAGRNLAARQPERLAQLVLLDADGIAPVEVAVKSPRGACPKSSTAGSCNSAGSSRAAPSPPAPRGGRCPPASRRSRQSPRSVPSRGTAGRGSG